MLKSRRMAWMLAVALAGAAWIAGAALGADQDLKIGVVDIEKAYKDAPRVKQYTEELNAFRDSLGKKLDIRSQNMMLDENEIKELIDLELKDTKTDKDKARIDELKKIERDKDEKLKQLQATKDLDDQKKALQNQLQEMQQKSKDTGNALAKDYDGQLSTKMQELNGKAETDIREAIAKIAAAKGFVLVVTKEAVLFGGTDITDDVIGKLDRKMQ